MAKFEDITLIKASAGSGKTYRLMELVSDYVAQEGHSPEQLMVTTFTRKAAAELRSKMRQRLIEEHKPEMAAKVFNGLIGTVDSVCERLLREYAVEAGLSPDFTVMSEENAEIIFQEAIQEAIEKYSDDLEPLAMRLELNKNGEYDKPESDWRDSVKKLVGNTSTYRFSNEMLDRWKEESCQSIGAIFPGTNSTISLEDLKNKLQECSAKHDVIELIELKGDGKSFYNKMQDFIHYPSYAKISDLKDIEPSSKKYPLLYGLYQDLQGIDISKSKELYDDVCEMIRKVFDCAKEAMVKYEEYKQSQGLYDFVDLERKVSDLLNDNPVFRERLKQRVKKVMVDEFQDTSPLQLEIFLKLNELCDEGSTWVGDPKQAIYGFRGTDPVLIIQCANALKKTQILSHSWRSKENLIAFSNAISTKMFGMLYPREDIELGIAPERKKKENTEGGTLEVWHLPGKKNQQYSALAKGVSDLLESEAFKNNYKPADIAILMKINSDLSKIAKEFAHWNIATTAPKGELLETQECALALAGFRYCLNPQDKNAYATIQALYPKDANWPEKLAKLLKGEIVLKELPKETDETPLELLAATSTSTAGHICKETDETPLELLERVIASLNLEQWCKSLPFSERRLANLDELRRLGQEYMKNTEATHGFATPAGFLMKLVKDKPKEASGMGENCVNLLTYHKAKGLEWPVVILGDIDFSMSTVFFGAKVIPSEEFDYRHPLAGYQIRYWPYPFNKGKKAPIPSEVAERLALPVTRLKLPELSCEEQREKEERNRVLYVGITRAKEKMIFMLPSNSQTSDFPMPDFPQLQQDKDVEEHSNWVTGSLPGEPPVEINLVSRRFMADIPVGQNQKPVFVDKTEAACDNKNKTFTSARKNPSGEHLEHEGIVNVEKCSFSAGETSLPGLSDNKPEREDWLGNSFHDFFALWQSTPETERRSLAERIIDNWQMAEFIKPETLITAAERLFAWLDDHYQRPQVSCEVPITYHDENGTLYQGYIDMLVETPQGYVIIDHKTGGRDEAPEVHAEKHLGQLRLYQASIEKATGKKVLELVIHLPLKACCCKIG
ncbi:MAG: UvrD-helicase domain-containing protein [Kiritimatiellae bacterium]|nr:UvrD-helicase domain-containing protein [Kiritimatiellia bacterium]